MFPTGFNEMFQIFNFPNYIPELDQNKLIKILPL